MQSNDSGAIVEKVTADERTFSLSCRQRNVSV